jgi:hypothetical protein
MLAEALRADGTLEVHGLWPGSYRVDVVCSDRPHAPVSDTVVVGPEPLMRHWDLIPEEEPAPREVVEDCSERGAIRVTTRLGLIPRVTNGRERGAGTSVRGRRDGEAFVFEDLCVGRYQVYMERAPEARREVHLARGGQELHVTLEPPEAGAIAGRVIDAQGEPLPDAWVRATHESAEAGRGEAAPTLTDVDGEFSLDGLFPGRYVLTIESAAGRAVMDTSVPGSTSVVARVSEHGAMRGTVVSPSGASESFVLAYRRLPESEVQVTAGVGNWSLPWLSTGIYELAAITESGVASRVVTLEAGSTLALALVVEPGATPPAWVQEVPHRGLSMRTREQRGEY